jgi:hypothetical protein
MKRHFLVQQNMAILQIWSGEKRIIVHEMFLNLLPLKTTRWSSDFGWIIAHNIFFFCFFGTLWNNTPEFIWQWEWIWKWWALRLFFFCSGEYYGMMRITIVIACKMTTTAMKKMKIYATRPGRKTTHNWGGIHEQCKKENGIKHHYPHGKHGLSFKTCALSNYYGSYIHSYTLSH